MLEADHFAFEVADMDASIKFYTETFDMKLLSRQVDEAHHEVFAFLEVAGGNLELLQMLDEDNQPIACERKEMRPPYCPHLALKTPDMEHLVSTLEEKQVTIIKGPLELPGQVKWIYIADPDNNVIEFIEWL